MYWPHGAPGNGDGEEQRRCARGEHCAAATTEWGDDGTYRRTPAYSPRTFCDPDRGLILRCVEWLPERYLELALRLGDRHTGDAPKVSGSATPGPPIRLDHDALMAEIISVVASWDERVRDLAKLAGPDTQASRRRREMVALSRMCATLAAHLDALLALPAAAMARHVPLERAQEMLQPGDTWGVVHPNAGWAEVIRDLSGADAGLEILTLDRRARALLGWTPHHQDLPVPCWDCGLRTIVRYDGNAGLEDQASCTNCRAPYEGERYTLLMGEVAKHQAAKTRRSAS